jgi:hypothetical protein
MVSEEPATAGEPDDSGADDPAPEASPSSSLSSRSPRSLLAAVRARPRRATLFVVLPALAVVGLISVGLAYRPNSDSVVIAVPSSVVLGPDGIPGQVDGQRVYRMGEKPEWLKLNGSFLLGAYATWFEFPCPMADQPPAEAALLGRCGGIALEPSANTFNRGDTGNGVDLSTLPLAAPKGTDALAGWAGGPAIVMSVHTHDPEALQCTADTMTACWSAVVVEAVVWPTVPSQINGKHVYRATDQASFPTSGSFLLGGPVWKDLGSPCSGPGASEWQALIDLLGFCPSPEIDGLQISPKGSFDEPKDEIVVARVHVNDPEAAKCPSDYRAQCKAAIVVESVVWRSS